MISNNLSQRKYPMVRIPRNAEKLLYLIREELKSQKLFHHLNKVGMGDSDFQPYLGDIILECAGLDDGKDETTNFYVELIAKRVKKINSDRNSITKQAMKVYVALMIEKDRRKGEQKNL